MLYHPKEGYAYDQIYFNANATEPAYGNYCFVTVFMLLRLMPLSGYFPQEILKETDEATRMTYLRNQGLLDHPFVQLWRFVKNLFKVILDAVLRFILKYP